MGRRFCQTLLQKLSCNSFSKKKVIPEPKLIFPGDTHLAVQCSRDTAALISKLTCKGSERPGNGNIIGHILNATSNMKNLISSAVWELEKLMEHDRAMVGRRDIFGARLSAGGMEFLEVEGESSEQETSLLRKSFLVNWMKHIRANAVAALREIDVKLVTVETRLNEVKCCFEKGENFDGSIRMATEECKEILAVFSNKTNDLFGNDNSLLTSPPLVGFVGIYAALARFQFEMFPRDRQHFGVEMMNLRRCVEDYREAAVARRLSYAKGKNNEEFTSMGKSFCADNFYDITSGEPCPGFLSKEDEDFHGSPKYRASLEKTYRRYFDEPLEELEKPLT